MKKLYLLPLAILLFLVACTEENEKSEKPADQVTPVEVEDVTKEDLVIEKQFYGRSLPESTTPVMLPVAGELDTLEVTKGDQVEEGEILAKIQRADGRGTFTIEAPTEGVITTINGAEGSVVSNTEPFAIIANLNEILIQVQVTAENLDLFEGKEEATVQFANIEGEFTANINYVASVAGETGLYPVELTLPNSDGKIKPGMTAEIKVPENVVKDTLLIPTSALVEDDEESFVYVVKDDKVSKVAVKPIEMQTDLTAVEGEISEGDQVVVSGQLTLTDGSKISIMEEESK
ncbi:efflux RND transporter periplasmic adaptor subunit [Aquibacillus kalidii]|uniref:efflux RND transporter periplasmic adaptor subunit n=1 Tax=Aquibacillus kalidii TaxID=2762597 RepID=UPI001644AADF|nr:efflux RND transporter periplasmic adaptor subunit [Aquibacillus kalidii]